MSRATRISGAVLHEGELRRWLFFVAIVNDAQSTASRLRYGPFPRHLHNYTPRPDAGPETRNWSNPMLPASGHGFADTRQVGNCNSTLYPTATHAAYLLKDD
ncbi:MAG TPA: hypothetical protein DD739_14705 [Ochrobactrum anthropi]|nr:hypothetical protein [Brucella anthropi]